IKDLFISLIVEQFLENDDRWKDTESKELDRWLKEAEDNIRRRFNSYRDVELISISRNNNGATLNNNINDVDSAMYKKKRPYESCLSESGSPLKKRVPRDQLFLQDVLGIETISLSSDLSFIIPTEPLHYTSDDVTRKRDKLVESSYNESNILTSGVRSNTLSCQNLHSMEEKSNRSECTSQPAFTNNMIELKSFDESSIHFYVNNIRNWTSSQLITTANLNNQNSSWPIGISYQPDFVEIVVTDAEMNAYWDNLGDTF
ncbi:unnamed protein product, partial [Rotaria socialis]